MLNEALDDFDEPAGCSISGRVRGVDASTLLSPHNASSPHRTSIASLRNGAQQLRNRAQRPQQLRCSLHDGSQHGGSPRGDSRPGSLQHPLACT